MDKRPSEAELRAAATGSADPGGHDAESLFFLRLPKEDGDELRRRLAADEQKARGGTSVGEGRRLAAPVGDSVRDYLAIKFDANDGRRATVRLTDDNGRSTALYAKLLDLPCIVEVHKTLDRKNFYKVADMCQILKCDRDPPKEVPPNPKHPERAVQHPHGVTPPMKNVRRRRFRRTLKKKFMDVPELERELKRLLRADMAAESVRWELAAAAPETAPSASTGATGDQPQAVSSVSAVDTSAARPNAPPVDEAAVFGGAVSSSSDEDADGDADGVGGKKRKKS